MRCRLRSHLPRLSRARQGGGFVRSLRWVAQALERLPRLDFCLEAPTEAKLTGHRRLFWDVRRQVGCPSGALSLRELASTCGFGHFAPKTKAVSADRAALVGSIRRPSQGSGSTPALLIDYQTRRSAPSGVLPLLYAVYIGKLGPRISRHLRIAPSGPSSRSLIKAARARAASA